MMIVIRTQSDNLVFNPKNIYLFNDFSTYSLKSFNSGQSDDILGIYDSSERARDIMFDIYRKLNYMNKYTDNAGRMVFAYEMPKE